jgi:aldehyde:ferredoxin oxidoreductase
VDGYYGRLLRVELSTGEARMEPIEERLLRQTIGGIGLGTALLLRYCPPGVEPLAPEAPLIFVSSPLVGTAVTTTAKFAVLFKSPLTGFIGDSLSSSHLALALKRTGYDALVLTGACQEWSLLRVTDDVERPARLQPARHLLGLNTWETELAVREDLAARGVPGASTAVIGPAGEHLVRYATISNDGRHAGRCGGGAVMGSKQLKALAVAGKQRATVAHAAALRRANARLIERSNGPATAKYRQLGTPANLLTFDRLGVLPSVNFQAPTFGAAERISGETLYRDHHARTVGCASCTVGCEHLYRTLDEPSTADEPSTGDEHAGAIHGAIRRSGRRRHADDAGANGQVEARLEYESLFALGPLLGVADPNAVIRLVRACDDLGLDTISAGGTIAWAMECAQRGVLPAGEAPRDLPAFGDAVAVADLLQAIAHRRGWVGKLLADGSRRAAAAVGQGSAAWAMHVKGLELPGYEPRGLKTLALGFAITPRGACHNRSTAYEADFSGAVDRFAAEVGRGQLVADAEDQAAVLDSLILCKFIRKSFDDLYGESAELLSYVTGWEVNGEELRQAGARINALKKLFNLRAGWTRADDTLPSRILDEPLASGPGIGERLTRAELDLMIRAYYAARGWTVEGHIPPAQLEALGVQLPVGGAAERPVVDNLVANLLQEAGAH